MVAPLVSCMNCECCLSSIYSSLKLTTVYSITVSVMYWFVGASIAELASAIPASGGGKQP